jgi:hypothetical protein
VAPGGTQRNAKHLRHFSHYLYELAAGHAAQVIDLEMR